MHTAASRQPRGKLLSGVKQLAVQQKAKQPISSLSIHIQVCWSCRASLCVQAGFLLLLLPLSCQLKGLSLPELPAYLKAGTDCLMGGSPLCGADCSGAPLLPLLYICVNVAFNVAAMYLVRSLGAVATALTMSCLVPITVLAFTLPLPFLQPAHLGAGFWWGSGLLMGGLLMFNARVWVPAVTQIGQKFQAKLADG